MIAVGLDVTDEAFVDAHVDFNHPRQRAAGDDDVVEREVLVHDIGAAHHAPLQQQPRLDRRPSRHQRLERRLEIGAADFRQEPEVPEVDAEERRVFVRMDDGAGGAEERAVAAERDDDVDVARQRVARGGGPSSREAGALRRCRARAPACSRGDAARPRPRPAPRGRRAASGGRRGRRVACGAVFHNAAGGVIADGRASGTRGCLRRRSPGTAPARCARARRRVPRA